MADADVVVIGAGSGGLATAAYLARAGRRVRVIDAREHLGGHLSAFTADGYEFDTGLQYTTADHTRALLHPLGIDVTLHEHDPDAIFTLMFPDMTFRVPKGVAAFRERLHAAFPGERRAIDSFLATVGTLAAGVDAIPDRLALRQLPDTMWQTRGLVRHARSTLGGYLDTLRPSPRLRAALCWLHDTCALPPSLLSLVTYARVVSGYLQGSHYPCGGGSAITGQLAGVIRTYGGEVDLGTEVSNILVTDGAVRGVRVRSASLDAAAEPAREVLAPVVVSAMDIKATFLDLLPAGAVPSALRHRMRGYEMPFPLSVLYLVLGTAGVIARRRRYTVAGSAEPESSR
jgi:all-trans-retinol 13,14-reductase